MTNLAADTARTFMSGDIEDLPVKASSTIYQGSAIGLTSGYARHLTAGDTFGGFADEGVASQTSDGDAYVQVRTRGRVELTITGVAVTDIGAPVFASDGNAFTLTQSTNSHIGRVARFVGTNTAIVAFDATRAGRGLIVPLTDSSGGTASDTLAAITGSYVEATIENTVASLAAKVNALIRQQN